MENISQVDIDKAVQLLKDNLMFEIAKRIEKADIISKLYVETYIESLYKNLKDVTNNDSLAEIVENVPKLQLYQITYAKNKLDAVKSILHNAIDRKGKFCDFDDSKFHDKVKYGKCQCEDHSENMNWDVDENEAEDKRRLELKPVYFEDEDTHKFIDKPEWWCKVCREASQEGDYDFDVSCDMEVEA